MRKAELLKHDPREPDFNDPGKRSNRIGYRRSLEILLASTDIFLTKDGSEILELDLWKGKALAARYFADVKKNSHMSYFPATGEWNRHNINNTALYILLGRAGQTSVTSFEADGWTYFSDEDEKRAEDHVRKVTGYKWGRGALNDWEYSFMSARREKYKRNRHLKIAAMMDETVPEIPDDFREWAETKFGHYVIQEKTEQGVRCTCTACHETWVQRTGLGTKPRQCPKCGTEVRGTYRQEVSSVPKGKRRSGMRLILMQPCRDNGLHIGKNFDQMENRQRWMERFFWADAVWDRQGRQVQLTEGIRIFLRRGETTGACWYLHWICDDGTEVWEGSNPANWRYGSGYVYPGTLRETSAYWNVGQIRSGIITLAEQGIRFDANVAVINAPRRPAWEYLVKNGLTRLAVEDIGETTIWGMENNLVNHKGKTAKEVLHLDGSRIDRLRRLNGGRIALKWLKYEQTLGLRISDETIRRYERRGYTPQSVWELLAYIRSPERLLNYLEKQAAAAGKTVPWVITEYRDYLNMAEKQGLNLKSDLFARPKDLIRAHDECVLFEKRHEITLKANGIRKKFPQAEAVMQEIKEKYAFTDGVFSIVVPQKIEDIIVEGRSLGHCIDTTDRYFDRIEQHISYLVFLRHANDQERSWYTLEIEPGGTVRQQRTTGNNQNKEDAEKYMPFIRNWQKEVRKRITAADRDLAEKSKKVRIREYKELRDKKETVWHGALAGKLLADVLESDLIEEVG